MGISRHCISDDTALRVERCWSTTWYPLYPMKIYVENRTTIHCVVLLLPPERAVLEKRHRGRALPIKFGASLFHWGLDSD